MPTAKSGTVIGGGIAAARDSGGGDSGYVQMDAVTPPSNSGGRTPSATPPLRHTPSGGIEGGPDSASGAGTTGSTTGTAAVTRGRAATVAETSSAAGGGERHGGASVSGYAAMGSAGSGATTTTTTSQDGSRVQTLRRRGQTTATAPAQAAKTWGRGGFTAPPAAADEEDGGHHDADGGASTPPVQYAWRARANTASCGSLDAAGATAAAADGRKKHHNAHRHRNNRHGHRDRDGDGDGDGGGAAAADEYLDAPLLVTSGDASTSTGGGGSHSQPARRRSSSVRGSNTPPPSATEAATAKAKAAVIVERLKETSWAVTADVLDLMPNAVTAKLFVPTIPDGSLNRLFELQEAMLVPFDRTSRREHAELIPALWAALCRVRPPLPMAGQMDTATYKSELWKDYGFQGVDPGTDFRGAGLLGARSVIWMCVEEPDISRAMMDGGYPFAIAVINVVMSLLHILHITKGKKTCLDTKVNSTNYTAQEARMRLATIVGEWQCASPTPGLPRAPAGPSMGPDVIMSLEDGLMNATAEACRVLHGEWLRSSGNVMEFNSVLKAAMAAFERLLRDRETYIRVSRAIDVRYPEAPLSCAGI